jgi:hypothetical protein
MSIVKFGPWRHKRFINPFGPWRQKCFINPFGPWRHNPINMRPLRGRF